MISIPQKCLVLWPILIVSGAFVRTGRGTNGGGEGGVGEEGGDELDLRHGRLEG